MVYPGEARQWDGQLAPVCLAALALVVGSVTARRWRYALWIVGMLLTVGWLIGVAGNASY